MNNIEEIANALSKIQAEASTYSVRLQRERGEMQNTYAKVQSVFGNQQSGQNLTSSLFIAMERTFDAYCEMFSLGSDVNQMIGRIKR